ncbi:MAG: hypothetical protein N4A36_03545 [Candidatus Gracilibacteria bacterium]|jgi:hypothetical protein|nr:hypothetical protein [Candidatus Gracilibacteria bacterium]
MKHINFLKKLLLNKKSQSSYTEELLGSRAKRRAFAKFYKNHEEDIDYLIEVFMYYEMQKILKKDLKEFKKGLEKFRIFFKACHEEEQHKEQEDQTETTSNLSF